MKKASVRDLERIPEEECERLGVHVGVGSGGDVAVMLPSGAKASVKHEATELVKRCLGDDVEVVFVWAQEPDVATRAQDNQDYSGPCHRCGAPSPRFRLNRLGLCQGCFDEARLRDGNGDVYCSFCNTTAPGPLPGLCGACVGLLSETIDGQDVQ